MRIEEAVIEKLRLLPLDRQREALDFVEFLSRKTGEIRTRKSSLGLCENLGISISKEEIDSARREVWANFPREEFIDAERDR